MRSSFKKTPDKAKCQVWCFLSGGSGNRNIDAIRRKPIAAGNAEGKQTFHDKHREGKGFHPCFPLGGWTVVYSRHSAFPLFPTERVSQPALFQKGTFHIPRALLQSSCPRSLSPYKHCTHARLFAADFKPDIFGAERR